MTLETTRALARVARNRTRQVMLNEVRRRAHRITGAVPIPEIATDGADHRRDTVADRHTDRVTLEQTVTKPKQNKTTHRQEQTTQSHMATISVRETPAAKGLFGPVGWAGLTESRGLNG